MILTLFFMGQGNPERLVGHLIERFGAELVAHVPSCSKLQQVYDGNEEQRRRSLTSLALASSTKRKRDGDDEDDEDKARAAKRH
jgi:hypothetical protein